MKKSNILWFLETNGFDNFDQLKTIQDDDEMILSLVKVISWASQINLIGSLYYEKFIPEAEKVDNESLQEIKILEKNYDIVANNIGSIAVDETVRFGYIALYHKLENCRNGLLNIILPVFNLSEQEFEKLYKEKFGKKFKQPKDGIMYKFSWIADCTKHQNAVASERGNPPYEFANYQKGKQISIDKETFKSDFRLLQKAFKNLILQVATIGFETEMKIEK